MNFDTLQLLDKLQQDIGERVYEEQAGATLWQDYEVMVCETADDYSRRWSRLPPEREYKFQRTEPRRRVVATRFAGALIWLFDELRSIHANEDEIYTFFDFYAELADTANEYKDEHKSGATATRLLETVLDKVRRIYT